MRHNILTIAVLFTGLSTVYGQAKEQTIAWLKARQTRQGGFTASPSETKPDLRATSGAIRALGYLGSEVPHADAARKFVADCFDKESGGFRPMPGEGTPDCFTTAVGIMAVVALKMPMEEYAGPVEAFLTRHAKSFEEIRIAAAGFEALGKRPPKADEWAKQVAEMQSPDGTFGKGEDRPRATGGAVAALLRLGARPKGPKTVLAVLKEGQEDDGGYGKEGAKTSDLETTYRVLRAFVMLDDRPDVPKLRAFIARCRNDDGGYGVTPDAPSTVAGTYYASILMYWLDRKD